jgi:hypothetical protein
VTDIGVALLGYAFMGKAHINAHKKLAYMVYPPPAQPRLLAITGRQEEAVRKLPNAVAFRPTTPTDAGWSPIPQLSFSTMAVLTTFTRRHALPRQKVVSICFAKSR